MMGPERADCEAGWGAPPFGLGVKQEELGAALRTGPPDLPVCASHRQPCGPCKRDPGI